MIETLGLLLLPCTRLIIFRAYNGDKLQFGKILEQEGPRNFKVKSKDGVIRRHIDQLRNSGDDIEDL